MRNSTHADFNFAVDIYREQKSALVDIMREQDNFLRGSKVNPILIDNVCSLKVNGPTQLGRSPREVHVSMGFPSLMALLRQLEC
jgi:hypothetical protein